MSICTTALLTCECHPVAPGYERVIAVGEIDLATGPRLADALRGAQARAPSVVLDLSGATFIDAGGVRILLAADRHARAAAGTFAIVHPASPVERVLQLVGADRALTILRDGNVAPEPTMPIRSAVRPAVVRRHGSDNARSATARVG